MMSSCEVDGSEGPKFNRKWGKKKNADRISPKNEDIANEANENMTMTGRVLHHSLGNRGVTGGVSESHLQSLWAIKLLDT